MERLKIKEYLDNVVHYQRRIVIFEQKSHAIPINVFN